MLTATDVPGMHAVTLRGKDVETWLAPYGFSDLDSASQKRAAELLVSALQPEDGLAQLVDEYPSLPPGVLGAMVPRTNLYVSLRGVSQISFELFLALLVEVVTDNAPAAVLVAAAAQMRGNAGKVSDDELLMLRLFRSLTPPGGLYKRWVDETALLAAYPANRSTTGPEALASLQSYGLVEEGAGLWRALR